MKTTSSSRAICILGLLAVLVCHAAISQETDPGLTWERPDADLSKFSKIVVKPLDLSDVKVIKPTWEQESPEEWSFTPETTETIQSMYMDIMTHELSKDGGIPVVTEEGKGVLQLEIELLSITPYVKPGSSDVDGYVVETLGSGDVVVSAELRDSETGELIFLVEGKRKIGTEYKKLSRESHVANVEETFSSWGQRLRRYLVAARGN
jgi:hypothetical protein